MATVTHRVTTNSTSNATSYASGSFTPAAGDLLVALVTASGTGATDTTMTDSQSLGWTRVSTAFRSASGSIITAFVSDSFAAASSMTVTFDCTSDAATGATIVVLSVSGMTFDGPEAVKQFKVSSNQAGGGTPAATFDSSVLTDNPTFGVLGSANNPPSVTEPTGWTEHADTGYNTPAAGHECVSRNSGFTGTTITWGSTSAGAFGVLIFELDASAGGTAALAQPHFRIKSGDTTSLTADSGWAAALDTNADIDAETPFRIRFEVEETASTSTTKAFKLQWRKNGGIWTDAAAPGFPIATSTPAVAYYPSSQYSDGAALTTNLLAGSSKTFVNGTAETSNNTANITLNNQHTEIEVCVMIRRFFDSKGVNVAGDDFEFRLVESNGTVFSGTYVIPSVNLTIPTGLVGGTFVETPNQVGPLKDGNGNLYILIEYCETGPNVMIAKSTDGGDTWTPMDTSNAPTKVDMESASMFLENDRLYIVHQNTSVWHYVFRVSTHATNADTWETIDEEITASVNASNQVCDIVRRSDGSLVAFYSKLSTNDRLFYKIKSGGSWGAEQTLESQAGSDWGGVAAGRGASDKIHIAYGGTSGNRYHKSLSSSDVLSARESLTTDGGTLASKTHGQQQPVYHDASGTEKILCAYQRNDNRVYARVITNDGTPGTEAQATIGTVFSKATSREQAARVGVQGTTHHIIYADETTFDGFYDKTTAENTWGTDVEFLDNKTIDLISGSIFTHSAGNGGGTVFGFIYANGTNGYTGDIWYAEKSLASGFTRSNDGGITPSGAISKQAGKVVSGAVTSIGGIAKSASKLLSGAISSIVGAVNKQTSKAFSGAISSIVGTLQTARIFLSNLSGALTPSGLLSKQAGKLLTGGVTPSGSIIKTIGKALSGALSSIVGTLATNRGYTRSFSGDITPSGIIAKQINKLFGGGITPSGTISKRGGKSLEGGVTSSGSLNKLTDKTFSGVVTLAGAVLKHTSKFFSGVLSSAGAVVGELIEGGQTFFQNVSGALTPTGTILKTTAKTFAGTLTSGGQVLKQTLKSFSGNLTSSGALTRVTTFARSLAGVIAPSGTVSKSISKFFVGTITSAGALVKQTAKTFSGAITSSGTLSTVRTFVKDLVGALTLSGTVNKSTAKSYSGSLSPSGNDNKVIAKSFSGSVTPSGTGTKSTIKSLAGSLTPSGVLNTIRLFVKILEGTLSSAGTLSKSISKSLSGTVVSAGSISKSVGKFLSGVISSIVGTLLPLFGGIPIPTISLEGSRKEIHSLTGKVISTRSFEGNGK